MMKDRIEHFMEDHIHRDVKLNSVFHTITDLWNHPNTVLYEDKVTGDLVDPTLPNALTPNGFVLDETEHIGACRALTQKLEAELRAAKSEQLSCGEVLLPADLLPRVALQILKMAETEPCGLRGCTIFINYESDSQCRRIGTIKCDNTTVSTFEIYLTLKQDFKTSWKSMLPQFIKNFTKGGTIVISGGFSLERKKLYRSFQD